MSSDVKEQQLKVVGMHCATCVVTVSKALSSVNGVKKAQVSLASGQASVITEGVRLKDVVDAVRKAGYDVLVANAVLRVDAGREELSSLRKKVEEIDGVVSVSFGDGVLKVVYNPYSLSPDQLVQQLKAMGIRASVSEGKSELPEVEAARAELRSMMRRLLVAIAFTVPTVALEFSGFPLYALLASVPVQFYSGLTFHRGAWRALKNRTTNMDTLVSLASNVAWFYSVFSLAQGGQVYVDTAALLVTFVLIGKTVEAYVKSRAVTSVVRLQVSEAVKLVDGKEVKVSSSELKVGDMVILRAGSQVPADGVIDEGQIWVDESLLTGEAKPVVKGVGEALVGGSKVVSGYAKLYVTRTGESTYLAQVLNAVREAQTARLPVQDTVDRVAAVFTPVILAASAGVLAFWLLRGFPLSAALFFAVAVLASACPCALGLATPMAVLTSVTELAKRGITVKDGEALQRLSKVRYVVFDKTGTLTEGSFEVRKVEEVVPGAMRAAASVEALSSHPLAAAIASASSAKEKVEGFMEFPGEGVYGKVGGHEVVVGSPSFARKNTDESVEECDVVVLMDWKPAAFVWLGDKLREGVKEAVDELKAGHHVVVATGDSGTGARWIGKELGVEVAAGLLPDQKVELVKKLKEDGPVAFVGDGINDAQALKEADVGIAISTGTELAKYAGDIIMRSPAHLPYLMRASKLTVRKVRENLAWAFGYNSALVPLAAGLLYPDVYISPPVAALAMSMSSVFVTLWSVARK
ncbi:MAG: heavy metal translocating P-type ATPase [Thermoprotei archaeon]